jgi:hypothetical protein
MQRLNVTMSSLREYEDLLRRVNDVEVPFGIFGSCPGDVIRVLGPAITYNGAAFPSTL